VGRVAASPTLKARGDVASLMLAITDGHATAATGAFASSLDGGRCALCGTTFLLSMRDGVPFCQTCLNSVQQRLQTDAEIVGKCFMLLYTASKSSNKFHDTDKTPTKGRLRPVTILERPHIRSKDNRPVVKVRCELVDPKRDDRNGVRRLLVDKISECFPVAKITADMKKNKWERPPPKRVIQKPKRFRQG
jgi:hypothetical protein